MVPSNLITRTGGATSSSISPLPSLSPASHSESLDKASLATEVIACVPPDNPNTTVLFHRTSKSEHTPLGLSKVSQKTPMALAANQQSQERLGHRIRELVSSGIWKAFSLTRNETPLSHLFFSNDLILYARVDLSQARLIAATLEEFSSYYGHWVSARKSQIYFSPNTNPETCAFISSFLGFQHVSNLGKYLRMPVQHSRTKCSDYDFIIDMMRARLNGWASQALSMAGHLTLAKSVLVAIPIYFMQTTRLSI
ncbi:hypothetical protein V6N12_013038 [Hibiscus sabdariffa]|uniref:Reverse transcriptase n=1 Tax=Hibiscus sabdariffa TaxID=183260 RepID=A0ABR2EG51_9ROSI